MRSCRVSTQIDQRATFLLRFYLLLLCNMLELPWLCMSLCGYVYVLAVRLQMWPRILRRMHRFIEYAAVRDYIT